MSGGWNTIESDAGVFTYLIEKLGVQDVQFEELISLDPEDLQQLSPLYGLIFLFKYPTSEPPTSTSGQPKDGSYDYPATDSLFFASQVIQNACGTQAILSVLLNNDVDSVPAPTNTTTATTTTDASTPPRSTIDIGPSLREFKDFVGSFPADLRGEALSNSSLIRSVHNSFARSSPFVSDDPAARRGPSDDDDDNAVYHFIAYTPIAGRLYELDGLQPAPIDHGACAFADFPAAVAPVLHRRIARYPEGEIRFNLLGVTRDLRARAREAGDAEGLAREEARRRAWMWENALRRHNFLGFAVEVLKGVVGIKVGRGEGEYEKWIEEAKGRTQKKVKSKRRGVEAMDMDVDA